MPKPVLIPSVVTCRLDNITKRAFGQLLVSLSQELVTTGVQRVTTIKAREKTFVVVVVPTTIAPKENNFGYYKRIIPHREKENPQKTLAHQVNFERKIVCISYLVKQETMTHWLC